MSIPSLGRWHVPAEWERHSRCWMAWPSDAESWPGGTEAACAAHAELAQAIAAFEPVTMICNPEDAVDAPETPAPAAESVEAPPPPPAEAEAQTAPANTPEPEPEIEAAPEPYRQALRKIRKAVSRHD